MLRPAVTELSYTAYCWSVLKITLMQGFCFKNSHSDDLFDVIYALDYQCNSGYLEISVWFCFCFGCNNDVLLCLSYDMF